MPKYRSHKEVYALKIIEKRTIRDPGNLAYSHMLVPEDTRYAPIDVTDAFVYKHEVNAPGYYVVYEDGYASWSPVEAFENGYTVIEGQYKN
jgi:hypothetical protein